MPSKCAATSASADQDGWAGGGHSGSSEGYAIVRGDVRAATDPARTIRPAPVESKWQAVWEREGAFHAEPVSRDGEPPGAARPPEGVRAGDAPVSRPVRSTSATSRTTRWATSSRTSAAASGMAVFHPMGYDSFGLPAENAAIRTGVPPARGDRREHRAHPRAAARRSASRSTGTPRSPPATPSTTAGRSGSSCGCSSGAWPSAARPRSTGAPYDQTVLANEQVIDGRCERCGTEVELRQLTQWFLRITDYAQRLLDDMDELVDWPERVLTMQRNWIGRSEGARVIFRGRGRRRGDPGLHDPPRHPVRRHVLHPRARAPAGRAPGRRPARGGRRPRLRRRRGAGLGRRPRRRRARRRPASSPAATWSTRSTASPIPVWVADYVLMDYGTGAIMAVPGHDERDFAFAQAHGLPIRRVIAPRGRGRRRAAGGGRTPAPGGW